MHKILVVDDEVVITSQLEERLTAMGCEVVGCASSGEEAVEMARRLRPNLILMDIVMPGRIDGIEASEIIKTELDIPVIFLTAYADDKFINRAKIVKPFGYIVKPFHEREIKAAIEVAIFKKKLERKLQESEEQFRAIVETAPSLLQICDAKSNVTYVSPNCEKITGYTQEEIRCGLRRWVHEDEIPRAKDLFERALREEVGGKDFEYKAVKKNGELWYASSSWEPLRDKEGDFEGIVLQTVDITERKRAEEALRKLNEELESKVKEKTKDLAKERDYTRHLMESSLDFQMTIDKDGRIMDVNAAFEKIVGKSREDVTGSSIYEYLPKEEVEELIAEVFEKKKVRNVEFWADIPGKGTLNLNLSATVFTTMEGEVGIYATGRDMTELRTKETQLIHAGRLASLGEMAAGVAHEINQPLSIISIAVEGRLRDIEKNRLDLKTLPQDMLDIRKNVKRIDRIITHMCTFARTPEPEEIRAVKPDEALNNAFILLGEQFRVHDISVSHEIDANLPAIKVDASKLEQVFVNILTNARQVLDERGEEATKKGESFDKQLICSVSRESEWEKDWIIFEFADNAYGVPEELKPRIFEPFFTTKEAGEGTGLGLSIAYSIVNRSLGGKIWVEDNDMGGASFKVAVPVKNENKTTETRRHEGL